MVDEIPETGHIAGVACPQCGRDYVQRAPRANAFERLLSLAYVYPFRCQLCNRRFRALQWGARYDRLWVNKREYQRLPCEIAAAYASDKASGDCVVKDISMGGCALATDAVLAPGTLLRLQLKIAPDEAPLALEAVTVHDARPGLRGAQFLRIAAVEHDRLGRYLFGLLEVVARKQR